MTKTTDRSSEEIQRTLDLLGVRPNDGMYEDCKELAKMFVAWQIADMLKIRKAGINA